MRSVLTGDTVEITVRGEVSVHLTGFIFESVFQRVVPGTFEHLKSLGNYFRTVGVEVAVFQGEKTVFHLLFGGHPRKTEADGFSEKFTFVGNKV